MSNGFFNPGREWILASVRFRRIAPRTYLHVLSEPGGRSVAMQLSIGTNSQRDGVVSFYLLTKAPRDDDDAWRDWIHRECWLEPFEHHVERAVTDTLRWHERVLRSDRDPLMRLVRELDDGPTGVPLPWAVRAGAQPEFLRDAWNRSHSPYALISLAVAAGRTAPEEEWTGNRRCRFPNGLYSRSRFRWSDGTVTHGTHGNRNACEARARLGNAPTLAEIVAARNARPPENIK